jgi:hypothetical protein
MAGEKLGEEKRPHEPAHLEDAAAAFRLRYQWRAGHAPISPELGVVDILVTDHFQEPLL